MHLYFRCALASVALLTLTLSGCAQSVAEPPGNKNRETVTNPKPEEVVSEVAVTGVPEQSVPIADAPASAAVVHGPIPEDYPQIEVERLQLANLHVERGSELVFASIIFRNPEQDRIEAGRLDFTAKEKAVVLLMASWSEEDEGTGEWTSEVLTRKQLGQTWIDLGPASWDETQILFARECKAGARYSIRTRKFDPPLPILAPHSLMAEKRREASTLREAMKLALRPLPRTPEETVEYLAYGVPEGAAVIGANNAKLLPLEGKNIPPYLQGAKIYRPVPSGRPGEPVSIDTIDFHVVRAGPLYLMASWEEEEKDLKDDPAYQELLFHWTPLGPCPWDAEYQLYFRNCEPGDAFAVRTRDGYPAMPIVASPVNLRAEARRSFPLRTEGSSAVVNLPVSVPEGGPLLDVQGMRLTALEGELVPDYLKGAVIYTPVPTPGDPYHGDGLLRFTVKRAGQVFLMATWSEAPDYRWDEPTLSYRELSYVWAPVERCPWDPDYWLFVRHCEEGEYIKLRTTLYRPPLPIIAPPVDLLDEKYAGRVSGKVEERELRRHIHRLIEEKQFHEVERLAHEFRDPDARFPSMVSPLVILYNQLNRLKGQGNQAYLDTIAELQERMIDSGGSLTTRVSLATMLRSYAYFVRGGGWASEVSERQFRTFHEALERARDVLLELDEDVPKDYLYYSELIDIGTGLGASRDEVVNWALAAAELDPWNIEATNSAAVYFLPRWHGEPGDLVRLAETLAEATRDECGEALYARVVMGVRDFIDRRTFVEDDFSWERTRQGLSDLRQRFPRSTYLLSVQCQLACLAFDRKLAKACFDEIGDDPELTVWEDPEKYEMERQAFTPESLTGDQDRVWMVHAYGAKHMRFSPDGTKVVTSGHDSQIKLWDVATGRELRRQTLMGLFNRVAFLNDETIVIGGNDGEIYFWIWGANDLRQLTRLAARIVALDCSPDGRYLFVADKKGNSLVIDWQEQEVLLRGEQDHGSYMTGRFSADSRFLVTTGSDGRIVIHNLEVGSTEATFAGNGSRQQVVAFSPDGKQIATGDLNGIVTVRAIDDWSSIAMTVSLESPGSVRELAFTSDGQHLIIARGKGEHLEHGGLSMIRLDGRSRERPIAGHATCVHDIDVSPDGRTLVSVGADWTIRLYDLPKLLSR